MKKCSSCGNDILPNTKFCGKCGAKISKLSVPTTLRIKVVELRAIITGEQTVSIDDWVKRRGIVNEFEDTIKLVDDFLIQFPGLGQHALNQIVNLRGRINADLKRVNVSVQRWLDDSRELGDELRELRKRLKTAEESEIDSIESDIEALKKHYRLDKDTDEFLKTLQKLRLTTKEALNLIIDLST